MGDAFSSTPAVAAGSAAADIVHANNSIVALPGSGGTHKPLRRLGAKRPHQHQAVSLAK